MAERDYAPTQRWATILVGAAVIGLVGWITLEQVERLPTPRRASDAGAEAAASDASSALVATGAPDVDAAPPPAIDAVDAGLSSLSLDALSLTDAGPLPSSAPRAVKIGVVLVQWQGAEGAATSTRPKAEALARANELAQQAKGDFRRAVTQGDPGSAEDIGRIPRGTLESRTEMVLFSMSPGDVSDVIETPRGYWVVKRIE
jgi:hypothetical protein